MSNTWARVEESLRAGDVPDHFIRLLRLAERSWIGAVASHVLPDSGNRFADTGEVIVDPVARNGIPSVFAPGQLRRTDRSDAPEEPRGRFNHAGSAG